MNWHRKKQEDKNRWIQYETNRTDLSEKKY